MKSDWEREQEKREWKEAEAKPPAFPKRENLIEFFVSATSDLRFFVDGQSLSVGTDAVVRYVLVVRSPSGAENVSFEGIRCATGEVKIYATGRPDGSWGGRPAEWRRVGQRWHNALGREYFCPTREPIQSAQEGVDALRRGGHPQARAPHLR